jgi:hypothetical protein
MEISTFDQTRFDKLIQPKSLLNPFVFQNKFDDVFTNKITLKDNYTMSKELFSKNFNLEKYRNTSSSVASVPVKDPKDVAFAEINNIINDVKSILQNNLLCTVDSYTQFDTLLESIKSRSGMINSDDFKKLCRSDLSKVIRKYIDKLSLALPIIADPTNTASKISPLLNLINELETTEGIINGLVKKTDVFLEKGKIEELRKNYKEYSDSANKIKTQIISILN